ncbi:hypothetical protein LTR99_007312 [Exophiala xenobiotica]|uniref:Velvet domain-containing protein n=1 Tax=Vermiconidia calcicola TaxID=1690605 RepID=A0AAV9Q413_9PEZI|nr:hypothetical protein LTR92_002682 [Exophiala xenobiotica]KAK5534421.1 hypothetical protein LTR25_006453 [Vermiconidia calcicola]KAK5536130.1 hypothetical protein LTR23_008151 [Chaetothyriales sp. CCFEE 6169]KAK5207359.1 hypothetical protein LTR41_006928 [Exophiala xenobiotica]KAK5228012.1 hypothetical protein LTR72_001895 [Exophiala xenobiotica]
MELAVAPPPKIAAGVILEIPIVVTFSAATSPEDGKQETQDGKEPIVLGDLSGVWAFVSLTTPDMEQSLAPPRTDLLRGRTADSIHPINEEQDGERPTLAYATFSDIVISEPGQYRLKVNIIDMNSAFLGESEGAPTVLPCLHSQVFDVVEDTEQASCGKEL